MTKNIGLVWLKDDFRIKKNHALLEATKNHNQVVAFFLFKKKKFEDQEAQKWWISKSLTEFKKKLHEYNINLEIIKTETYKNFFEKLFDKKNFSIYWNKTYEPNYIEFDKYLSKNFKLKNVNFKVFKGNILNEYDQIQKIDGTPFKVFTPYWRSAEKFYLEKIPPQEKKITKCKSKISFFKNTVDESEIFPKKNWFKKFEDYWSPSEESALKELKNFKLNGLEDYSEGRNFPYTTGTSKLSPYIKHGQIHVETIWEECFKIKRRSRKFLAEIGWREFNHSLINYFPHMLKEIIQKNLINFRGKKFKIFNSMEKRINRISYC